jgi:hypothetical protein
MKMDKTCACCNENCHRKAQRLNELVSDYERDKAEIAKALGTDPIHNDMMREAETLTRENRSLRNQIADMSDMIDHRDEALLCIGRILRDKETQHKDLMLGSTAFKSALSWAEFYLPRRI